MTKQQTHSPDITDRAKRLSALIQRPKKEQKRPSDFALWWAWVFFNLVAFLFDLIAATTVYQITGQNWLYGILTFFAGFLPLMMHEFGFIRAGANKPQKITAVLGAVAAIGSIVAVGILAGVINVTGITNIASRSMEIGVIVTLVLISVLHGVLAGIYFYTDDGIKRKHTRAETMAYAYAQIDEMKMAGQILDAMTKALAIEDKLNARYQAPDVLREIAAQLSGDELAASEEEDAPPPPARSRSALPLAAAESAAPMGTLRETGAGLWNNLTAAIKPNGNGAHPEDPI